MAETENSHSHGEFLKLFLSSNRQLYGYVVTLVPNRVDAEDILQETACVMWDKFSQYEPGTSFVAWGRRIARFKVLQYYEKQRRDGPQLEEETLQLILSRNERVLDGLDPRLEALRHCIGQLDRQDQLLVRARYREGITIKEIAQRMQRSVNVCYKRMAVIHTFLMRCVRRTVASWE